MIKAFLAFLCEKTRAVNEMSISDELIEWCGVGRYLYPCASTPVGLRVEHGPGVTSAL